MHLSLEVNRAKFKQRKVLATWNNHKGLDKPLVARIFG